MFEEKCSLWLSRLLDLSKRNPQLNFNPNLKRRIEILSPSTTQLFRLLIVSEKTADFIKVFNPREYLKIRGEQLDGDGEGGDSEDLSDELKKAHDEALKRTLRQAKVSHIVTSKDDVELERRLRRTKSQSKTHMQEKGINVLYLAFGLLSYTEYNDDRVLHAPVLFVPVVINRESILDSYNLSILDDEIVVNPALSEIMQIRNSIDLPAFPEDYSGESVEAYFQNVEEILKVQERPAWKIERRFFLDRFLFGKLSMYHDLKDNLPLFRKHEIVRAIGDGFGFKEPEGTIPSEQEYNDEANPHETFTILDADSSQFRAIQYAKKGASLVIRGPPGTGKSQCISNIIAECIAAEKRVLFVAQKQAALEVVKRRLDRAGIGVFCLELHAQKANKKEVITDITRNFGISLQSKSFNKVNYSRVKHLRNRLNQYVESVNAPRGATGKSLRFQIGLLAKLQRELKNDPGTVPRPKITIPSATLLSNEDLFRIHDILNFLESYKPFLKNYSKNRFFKPGQTWTTLPSSTGLTRGPCWPRDRAETGALPVGI